MAWPAASSIGDLLRREGLAHPRRRRKRTPPYTEPLKHAQDSLDHISGVVDNIKPAPAPLPPAPSYSASSAEAAVSAVLKKLDSIDKAVNRRAGRTTGGSNQ